MVKIDHVSHDLLLRLHDKKMAENVESEKQKIKAKFSLLWQSTLLSSLSKKFDPLDRVLKQTVLEGYHVARVPGAMS